MDNFEAGIRLNQALLREHSAFAGSKLKGDRPGTRLIFPKTLAAIAPFDRERSVIGSVRTSQLLPMDEGEVDKRLKKALIYSFIIHAVKCENLERIGGCPGVARAVG